MTQWNTSSSRVQKYLLSPRRVIAVKVPRMKRFLEEERMEEKKSRFCYPSEKSE